MSGARPKPGALIARLDEISDPGAIVRDFREGEALFSLLITRRGAAVSAFENRCPHAGFPLERFDGRVVVLGENVLCSAHGALFALRDGACVAGPGTGRPLTPFSVELRDGAIFVRSIPGSG